MSDIRKRAACVAVLALALAACGVDTKTGSNGTGLTPPSPEPTVVAGALVGVEPFATGNLTYETTITQVRQDATAGAGTAGLRLGMFFEASGNTTGSALPQLTDASVQSAVRGPVASVDVPGGRFRVASLVFNVDANTIWDGIAGLAGLAAGQTVEVHGLPVIEARAMVATRVTLVAPPADGRITIAARIDQSTAAGFVLAGLSVAAPVSVSASPVSLAGNRARVTGTLVESAGAIVPDRIELLPEYPAPAGGRVELEGIVLSVDNTGGFRLRTPARDIDVTTIPAGPAIIAPGVRARVLGRANGPNAMVPQFVGVVAPGQPIAYRVTGVVSEFVSLAQLRVRGEPVNLTAAAIQGGTAADIANGKRLTVTGTAGPGALRVTEVTVLP